MFPKLPGVMVFPAKRWKTGGKENLSQGRKPTLPSASSDQCSRRGIDRFN